MDQRLEPLFTPWKIGSCEIKNRVVLTSMGGTNLLGWMEINHFDKAGAKFIMEVAKNNCGLVLPGCQPVYNPMLGQWLYKNKKMFKQLKEFMEELPEELFFQVHRSFVVNLSFVESFDGANVYMEDGTKIPVSKAKRDVFKSAMIHYMKGRK